MKQKHPAIEFEATVQPGGLIRIPRRATRAVREGLPVTVRVSAGIPGKQLRRRGVTEAEIERIADIQMTAREHVVTTLASEGALAGRRNFATRAHAVLEPTA